MSEQKPNQTNIDNQLTSVVADILKGETTMGAALGFDANDTEAIYAIAYNVYTSGKYNDAMKLFGILSLLDPLDYRFVFGGASCAQMLGEYLLASLYFQLAAGMEHADPAPMLHTAECLLALKDKDGARGSLEQALQRAGSNPAYANLKKKAEVMLENLSS